MDREMRHLRLVMAGLILLFAGHAVADTSTDEELDDLDRRISSLEAEHGEFSVGGAAWLNYEYNNYDDQIQDRLGDGRFDLFRMEARGSSGPWEISGQYRWYEYMDVVHHAWIGYNTEEDNAVRIGIHQVPFGLQPYASHSYWFGVPYYLGFEDDYQTGVTYLGEHGDGWDVQAGFYFNDALATPGSNDRYAWNIITNDDLQSLSPDLPDEFAEQSNRQSNQLNLRLANTFFEETAPTEIGFSGQYGQLYNEATESTGDHHAWSLHSRTRFGEAEEWGLELQYIDYQYNPENPEGISDDAVLYGAFLFDSLAAADGEFYIANITRDFAVDWGPVTHLDCYYDHSILNKSPAGWDDSVLQTLGCGVTAGPTYTFVDIIHSKNHNFMNRDPVTAFAQGEPGAGWETRFNINLGIYF